MTLQFPYHTTHSPRHSVILRKTIISKQRVKHRLRHQMLRQKLHRLMLPDTPVHTSLQLPDKRRHLIPISPSPKQLLYPSHKPTRHLPSLRTPPWPIHPVSTPIHHHRVYLLRNTPLNLHRFTPLRFNFFPDRFPPAPALRPHHPHMLIRVRRQLRRQPLVMRTHSAQYIPHPVKLRTLQRLANITLSVAYHRDYHIPITLPLRPAHNPAYTLHQRYRARLRCKKYHRVKRWHIHSLRQAVHIAHNIHIPLRRIAYYLHILLAHVRRHRPRHIIRLDRRKPAQISLHLLPASPTLPLLATLLRYRLQLLARRVYHIRPRLRLSRHFHIVAKCYGRPQRLLRMWIPRKRVRRARHTVIHHLAHRRKRANKTRRHLRHHNISTPDPLPTLTLLTLLTLHADFASPVTRLLTLLRPLLCPLQLLLSPALLSCLLQLIQQLPANTTRVYRQHKHLIVRQQLPLHRLAKRQSIKPPTKNTLIIHRIQRVLALLRMLLLRIPIYLWRRRHIQPVCRPYISIVMNPHKRAHLVPFLLSRLLLVTPPDVLRAKHRRRRPVSLVAYHQVKTYSRYLLSPPDHLNTLICREYHRQPPTTPRRRTRQHLCRTLRISTRRYRQLQQRLLHSILSAQQRIIIPTCRLPVRTYTRHIHLHRRTRIPRPQRLRHQRYRRRQKQHHSTARQHILRYKQRRQRLARPARHNQCPTLMIPEMFPRLAHYHLLIVPRLRHLPTRHSPPLRYRAPVHIARRQRPKVYYRRVMLLQCLARVNTKIIIRHHENLVRKRKLLSPVIPHHRARHTQKRIHRRLIHHRPLCIKLALYRR